MKKINLAICILFFSVVTLGQKQEPVNSKNDHQEFEGYTIRLLPAMGGTYGYDILKGNDRVIHQSRNPFTFSSKGLVKKEDAFKLAQWQIRQLKARRGSMAAKTATVNDRKIPDVLDKRLQYPGNNQTFSNQWLSPKIAEQLHITITH